MLWTLILAASAGAPAHLPVQARLLDAQGTPIEDPIAVTFALYTQSSGGSALYSEMRMVDPQDGYFSVFLGQINTLDWSLVDGSAPLFVGMTLADAPELPRQAIGTVPFAAFADRAATAGDADTVGGLDVDGVVAEVVATYPSILNPYSNADAVAAMGPQSNSNPLNHARYTDTEAVDAMGAQSNSNPLNHARYTVTEAVDAMGAQSNSNPLNHARYTVTEAVDAMGAQSNSNPLNHVRYADSEAVSAVSASDAYVRNTGDTVSGPLYVTGGVAHSASSPLPARPWMTSFHRASNGNIVYRDGTNTERQLAVGDGTSSVRNEWLSFLPSNDGDSGTLYFNIIGSSSNACTLLSAEDDFVQPGLGWATDNGNNVRIAWDTSSDVRTFMLERRDATGVPIGVNTAFRIICF